MTYTDECTTATASECKLLGNFLCEEVGKTVCKKVPQYGTSRCQMVPRLTEVCKKVPVKRPMNSCTQIQRNECDENNMVCKEMRQDKCENVPIDVVKEICEDVDKEVCENVTVIVPVEEYKENCKTVPEKVCKQGTVKRPRIIPKRICQELRLKEEAKLPSYEES